MKKKQKKLNCFEKMLKKKGVFFKVLFQEWKSLYHEAFMKKSRSLKKLKILKN